MFKKDYLLIFIVIGLGFLYLLFALLAFFTRGKSTVFLKKKLAITVAIITFSGIIGSVIPVAAQEAGDEPSAIPTATPTPTPMYGIQPTPLPLYGTMPPETPEPVITAEPSSTPIIVPLYAVPTNPPLMMGDVNASGNVDIVDSLLIAQYYIGLEPANFIPTVADVNEDSKIDIIDALLVAQKYIGLIDEYPKKQ
jgi:hypothetical protein